MYPTNKEVREILENNFQNGNFSLWYNKYIPIDEYNYKPIRPDNDPDKKKKNIEYYKNRYYDFVKSSKLVKGILKNKHLNQIRFLNNFKSIYKSGYETITVQAKTITPLIIGIGESHPSETSLIFDHILGIPYIPSTSIKGCVRLSYILSLIFNGNGSINDDIRDKVNNTDKIKYKDLGDLLKIFGGQEKIDESIKSHKGGVIFLDSYPLDIPELKVEIMNPHFPDYYKGGNELKPPADWQTPTPIKFLAVKEETFFIFRFLVPKNLKNSIKTAIKKTLLEEGIGAKTSIGYGRFEILEWDENEKFKKIIEEEKKHWEEEERKRQKKIEEERLSKMSNDERMIYKIKNFKFENPDDVNERRQKISELVSECFNETFGSEVYKELKQKLEELNEWSSSKDYRGNKIKNKKRKQSLRERNEKIERLIKGEKIE